MQDVEKTEIQRNTSAKRMRRRNRLRPLYFLVVAVLVAGVGIALSMTAFFNIATIEVGGNKPKQYNEDEIAHASGVHTGDNMMRLNKEEVAQNILDSLVFVEDVQVEKKFPDVLVITVSASRSAFNVVDDSGTLQVSAAGKILKNSPDADSSLPTVTGYEAATREAGQKLTSQDSQKDQIFQTISKKMAGGLTYPITSVDLTDKYDIKLVFDSRVEFEVGNWSELDYKITLAETVLDQLAPDKIGYLSMIGDHQCSYRDKSAVEQQTTAALATTATDENGMPILETDENGNPISPGTETTTTAAPLEEW